MTDPAVSARMSKVKGSGNRLEVAVRRLARSLGLGFGTNVRSLPGTPDLANKRERWAVFSSGCFWHAHGCAWSSRPRTNRAFWDEKFARNRRRDARVQRALRRLGYRVVVVWECDVAMRPEGVRRRLERVLL